MEHIKYVDNCPTATALSYIWISFMSEATHGQITYSMDLQFSMNFCWRPSIPLIRKILTAGGWQVEKSAQDHVISRTQGIYIERERLHSYIPSSLMKFLKRN
jgi:hypothetical protein